MLTEHTYPIPLWTTGGVSFTLGDNEVITCDMCGFPLGNEGNTLAMLFEGSTRHAQRHAEPLVPTPAYLGDTPTPRAGWFDAKPRYNAPDAYLVIAPGVVVVETNPQEACVLAASIDERRARVLGPLPLFADFTDPVPPAAIANARGLLRALPPAGPVTTAELDSRSPRERELVAEDDARRDAEVTG